MGRAEPAPRFCRLLACGILILLGIVTTHAQPFVQVLGPASVCPGSTNIFTLVTDVTNVPPAYTWQIGTNNTSAEIIGASDQNTVQVVAGTNGSFDLIVTVTDDLTNATALTNILILTPITSSPLVSQIACPGTDVTFATTPGGDGPFTFFWTMDNVAITDATNNSLTLSNVSAASAAEYCVIVAGACGIVTNCATLTVTPPPAISCPTNITVECLADVPAPDTNSVTVAPLVLVFHLGDTILTNGCEFEVTRAYAAVGSCSLTSVCYQVITVRDTIAPTISCNTNRIVECTDAWTFDTPTVSDTCDTNVLLTILDTVTNNSCGVTFTTTRTWLATDACGNTNICSQTIDVVDTTAPAITCNTNRIVECTGTWTFDTPTVSDACDTNVLLTILDTTTNNNCGVTFTTTRTWLATDACGNTNICSQTIDVVDTTAPTITCNTNRIVECTDAWTFDTPTFSDACDTNVSLTILGTTTNNHCSVTFTATRTWLATDACGNTNSCSQTIDVVDTTAPVIACSSNIVVECTGPAGTPVSFTLTATDACDTNILIYSVPPSGTAFTLGTNVINSFAVDSCGNTNTCSFTVTIIDTTPPTISCPPNIIAAEQPRDSGGALITYATPVIGDICDGALSLVTLPPSGFVFTNGITTVNAVVTDDSGNTNACSFTVRVIPYRLYVTNLADSGPGTLRQALLDANDAPGENLILFNLPVSGLNIIALDSPLPEITSPIIINGWSQPGFVNVPLVEVTGSYLTNAADGLVISAGSSTVRGLILNGFATGLKLLSNGNNVVQGNFIGTGGSGLGITTNTGDGLYISCSQNLIGGQTNLSGNVFSGNAGSGIHLSGAAATLNIIRGNFIGVGVDGTTPVGNSLDGIRIGNGASKTVIGAISATLTNVIAFNGRNGITLEPTAGSQNAIFANVIHDNAGLAVDLGNDGPTDNDSDDPDPGPNDLQNAPLLTDARSADGGLIIDGVLNSSPNATYRLDFWLNNTATPSTNGQGQFYLGSSFVQLPGSGTETFQVGFAVSAVHTQYVTATAMDLFGNSSEFSLARQVRTPPVLESVPTTTNTTAGGSVTFCATASGTPPIFFQWRLNGANIPHATNQCYTVPLAQVSDAGTYSVVVFNVLGGSLTPPAKLSLTLTNILAAGDDFVDRVTLVGESGQVGAANQNATREAGEPDHAGKPGGKSVWYTWKAPITGIATIGIIGSDFDTLLGAYMGTNVAFLETEVSDEDGNGFFRSGVRFNAIKNREYHFAIDGHGGDSGDFVFGWQMEDTPHLLPVIATQPISQTVPLGDPFTFFIVAQRQCGGGKKGCNNPDHYPHDQLPGLSVQWFFEGDPIPGATNYSLIISNVLDIHVGRYTARVTAKFDMDGVNRTVESQVADLQINSTGDGFENIQAKDKLIDALLSNPWIIGNEPPALGRGEGSGPSLLAAGIVRGYTGTQIFNTAGSTTSTAEDPICGVLGGSSEWITFVAVESGDLFLNTDGSSYDTVMAIFRRNPSNPALLTQIGCNNNGGLDGIDSALTIPVTVGETNAILIDGVNGTSGILKLNYSLVPKVTISLLGITPENQQKLRVTGRTNLNFSIQRSTNLIHWTTILTTNAPSGLYDYLDPITPGQKFYRAKMLP